MGSGEEVACGGRGLTGHSVTRGHRLDSSDLNPTPCAHLQGTSHPTAARYVGHWHFYGEGGFPPSDAAALRWYEKAAAGGDGASASQRDRMYLKGRVRRLCRMPSSLPAPPHTP